MEFDAILLPPRRAASVAQGLWRDRTINDELDACVAECPGKTALTALRSDGGEARRFTYRELAALADRMAVGLHRLGVRRNIAPDIQRLENPHDAGRKRRGARIGRRGHVTPIDQGQPDAWHEAGQRQRQRQPDGAAAGDDDVVTI